MKKFLNDIRSAENPISGNRKIINTIAILFLGIALGTFSKYLDFRQTELPGVLMAINGVLDIGNFLLGVRFSTDYDVAPPVVRSSRERLHKLTFGMEVCAVF